METYTKVAYTEENLAYLIKKSLCLQNTVELDYLHSIQDGKITSNNREHLVNWVLETCEIQKVSSRTMHLAIYYLNSFLQKKRVSNLYILELLGYICISIALKYEEGREITAKQITALCDSKFSQDLIQTMEIYTLSLLDWQLDIPTPGEILEYLLKFTCEDFDSSMICQTAQGYFAVALCDYEISRYPAFVIAVAGAICAFENGKLLEFCEQWIFAIENQFEIRANVFWEVARKIQQKINSYEN